jgi:hypothetical protein
MRAQDHVDAAMALAEHATGAMHAIFASGPAPGTLAP